MRVGRGQSGTRVQAQITAEMCQPRKPPCGCRKQLHSLSSQLHCMSALPGVLASTHPILSSALVKNRPPQHLCAVSVSRTARNIKHQLLILDTKSHAELIVKWETVDGEERKSISQHLSVLLVYSLLKELTTDMISKLSLVCTLVIVS